MTVVQNLNKASSELKVLANIQLIFEIKKEEGDFFHLPVDLNCITICLSLGT